MPSHAQTHFRVRLLAAAASALVFAPLAHAQANPTLTIDTPGPGGMAHVVTATDNMGVTVTGAGIANIGGGGRVSIDGRTPMSYVRTTNGGTSFISEINISGNGGISQNSALATAMYGSTVTLIDSSIRNTGDVAFWAARGNMDMNVPGSTVHMDNVILEGNGRALVVAGDSTVDVRNSHIEATRRDGARMNYAVQVTDSQFTAVDTTISGTDAAVKITTESRPQRAGSTVVLDNARLIAEGAGIRIERGVLSAPGDFTIDVDIRNGTTIKADSGTLLSVTSVPNALTPYHVNVNVDNSVLEGDMTFRPEHVTNEPIDTRLRLDNNAILTGRIEGLAHLHVNNDAEWRLVDNQVLAGEVIMGGGVIDLRHGEAPGQFRTLEIATLAGEGTFRMQTDLEHGGADQLHLSDNDSSGQFKLDVLNTGAFAAIPVQQLVQDDGGAATFSVIGDKVDLGARAYELVAREADGKRYWELVRTQEQSNSTETVLGAASALPTVWLGEITTLRARLGEVRLNEGKGGGVWARTFGNRYNAKPAGGHGYSQDQWGVLAGADGIVASNDAGQWLVGAMAGTSTSRMKFGVGSTGSVESYTLGMYATWLGKNGYYFDGVFKYNRYASELDVMMRDGRRSKGDYHANGLGLSTEFGRKLSFNNGWFVEPYAQVAAMMSSASDYTLDNGLQVDAGRGRSVQGALGIGVGKTIETKMGTFEPYVRAAVVQEFAKHNAVVINGETFNNDLSGTRAEFSVGLAAQMQKNLQAYVDTSYAVGKRLEKPWGVNVGVRYTF
ncbi:autotransporter outer membrane beta-barrel domain-containing protein [Pandoraea sputorum]|uniref:P.93 n=2 Tax=Pandoraea sputorum TaxID=93222 RepID=A0A239SCE7_9BURK|nr:autotransporter outer membrane beta-barrel domain-containing protein [Pandoraea sputorum]SNU82882.1 P.93 [Pandoraea sputorum]VVE13023.1 putative autotransporter [Pandoraea sputorum]